MFFFNFFKRRWPMTVPSNVRGTNTYSLIITCIIYVIICIYIKENYQCQGVYVREYNVYTHFLIFF